MQVPGLHGMPPGQVVRRTYQQFRDDDVLSYSAALAFHGLLSLFPFLLFLVASLAFLHLGSVFDGLLAWSSSTLPPDAAQQVRDVVQQVTQERRGDLLSLGLLGALWAASGGIRSAMRVINEAYDVEHGRPLWRRIALSVAYTIGLVVLALLSGVLLFIGPELMTRLASHVGLGDAVVTAWRWLRWPVAAGLLVVSASLLYTVLPRVERFRLFTPGAVVAVVLWLLVSWLFRLYVVHFGSYSRVYGSLGAVVVLLLYLWIASIILLVGAELNAVLRAGTREARVRKAA